MGGDRNEHNGRERPRPRLRTRRFHRRPRSTRDGGAKAVMGGQQTLLTKSAVRPALCPSPRIALPSGWLFSAFSKLRSARKGVKKRNSRETSVKPAFRIRACNLPGRSSTASKSNLQRATASLVSGLYGLCSNTMNRPPGRSARSASSQECAPSRRRHVVHHADGHAGVISAVRAGKMVAVVGGHNARADCSSRPARARLRRCQTHRSAQADRRGTGGSGRRRSRCP